MGGHLYWYFAEYKKDLKTALQELREGEFIAGRYNPVTPCINFPIDSHTAAPGAKYLSIEEALEASDAEGTRSILDLAEIYNFNYVEALELSI